MNEQIKEKKISESTTKPLNCDRQSVGYSNFNIQFSDDDLLPVYAVIVLPALAQTASSFSRHNTPAANIGMVQVAQRVEHYSDSAVPQTVH